MVKMNKFNVLPNNNNSKKQNKKPHILLLSKLKKCENTSKLNLVSQV